VQNFSQPSDCFGKKVYSDQCVESARGQRLQNHNSGSKKLVGYEIRGPVKR